MLDDVSGSARATCEAMAVLAAARQATPSTSGSLGRGSTSTFAIHRSRDTVALLGLGLRIVAVDESSFALALAPNRGTHDRLPCSLPRRRARRDVGLICRLEQLLYRPFRSLVALIKVPARERESLVVIPTETAFKPADRYEGTKLVGTLCHNQPTHLEPKDVHVVFVKLAVERVATTLTGCQVLALLCSRAVVAQQDDAEGAVRIVTKGLRFLGWMMDELGPSS